MCFEIGQNAPDVISRVVTFDAFYMAYEALVVPESRILLCNPSGMIGVTVSLHFHSVRDSAASGL